MPAVRTPAIKAAVAARNVKDPQRYRDRKDPKADALGDPPEWFSETQRDVWAMFAREVPWLNGSHRSVLEIAVIIRSRLVSQEDVGVQALNLLRQCLGQMGATPADATKVSVPDDGAEDPDEAFFKARPN